MRRVTANAVFGISQVFLAGVLLGATLQHHLDEPGGPVRLAVLISMSIALCVIGVYEAFARER